MSRLLIRLLKFLLPLVLVGGAGLAAYMMYLNRPLVETQLPVFEPPGVRVQVVAFETVNLTVTSQGTVRPRTTSQLVPEISGPVVEVAPSFAVGGFFEAGDVLLKIDPYDYLQAVIAARSQLAQTQLQLAQEEAEAEVARREWEELGRGAPSALTLRQPHVEEARAAVAAAEAALDRAARDVERAEIKAPYAGRVQSKNVDVGQFVNRGTAVAGIYAIDAAEIRLPLPDADLAYVDVSLSYRGGEQQTGPRVTLSADFAGQRYTWQGRIVRTESEIDPVSRMVHVVAEVRDPYGPGGDTSRPPLAAGMFVEAVIAGRTVSDVVALPWAALRGRDQVLVVDESSRLRFRQVDVLRSTSDTVFVRDGLAPGELVSVSSLDVVTDGMAVRVLNGDLQMAGATSAPAATAGDTGTRQASDTLAPAPDSERAEEVPAPTIDPTVSREEQIASIRRQLEILGVTLAAGSTDAPERSLSTAPRVAGGPSTTPAGASGPAGARGRAGAGVGGGARVARRGRGGRGGGPGARGRGPGGGGAATRAPAPRADPPAAAAADPEPDDAAPPPVPVALTTRTVAVVPFSNLSRDPEDDGISADLTAALGTALEEPGVQHLVTLVAADTSTAIERAEARRARWLVAGGVQRSGSQLRITARVLDVASGDLVGTVKVDGGLEELETLTTEMVAAVRAELAEVDDAGSASRLSTEGSPVGRPDTPRLGVAVLPFANVSRNPADDGLSGDVAAALAGGLRQLDGGAVVTLAAEDEMAALEAATARNTAWLISGGYQHVGGRLRITARLLDVATGDLIRTVKVDGTLEELSDLLTAVVATFGPNIRERTGA